MSTTTPTIKSTIFDGNNDLMILTNKNIVSKITNADDLPLCSVASYSIAEYLSSETSAAIERIDDISATYFKLSNDNNATGNNTFNNVTITGSTYTSFDHVFNNKSGKLSALINGVDTIETVGNIYRTIGEICLVADLTTKVDYNDDLGGILITTVKSIINEKSDKLHSIPQLISFIETDDETLIEEYSIGEYLDILQLIIDNLDIKSYSLQSKLNAIEQSIDALDIKLTNDINGISTAIDNMKIDVKLSTEDSISIITDIIQRAGNLSVYGTQLMSTHVSGLPEYATSVNTSVDNLAYYVNNLSTHQIVNTGNSDANAGIYLDSELFKLSTGWNGKNYMLCVIHADKCIASVSANEFIQDSLLSSVTISGDGKSSVLHFKWITKNTISNDSTIEYSETNIPISNLIDDIYKGENGIVVNDKEFKISADFATIAPTSSVTELSNKFVTISADMLNLAAYVGHIDIKDSYNSLSICEILGKENVLHASRPGFVRNGSMFEVNWHDTKQLSSDELKSNAFITTKDGVTLHHKDMMIIHYHETIQQYIPIDDIKPEHIKVITSIDFPLFYDLCCTVYDNYVWLSGGNSNSNNHAISGNNDYVGLHNFDEISAKHLSIDLSNLINANSETSAKYSNVYEFIISTELSVDGLSNMLSTKVIIDDVALGTDSLNVKHVSQNEYYDIAISPEGALSNTIYIVSSDTLNMYGEKIQNLANGESEFDAINLGQLNAAKANLENAITTVSNELTNETNRAQLIENAISTNLTAEINRASTKDTELQSSIDSISTNIENKIWIDGNNATNLSLCHISQEKYYDTVLTATDEEISNVLFIISGDNHNAFGKRITNLCCNPDELKDAATVEYVNSKVSIESNLKTKEFAEMIYDSLSSNGISAGANFDDLNAQHALSVLLSLANALHDYLKA